MDVDGQKLPAVLKPRYGSGNREVHVIRSREALHRKTSQEFLTEDYVLEDLVEGVEYGLDGAVINGRVQLILLREKMLFSPEIRQCVGYYSIDEEAKREEMKNMVSKAVELMGLNQCLFHADLIYRPGDVFIIELSARPSGHYLYNVFVPLATGIHVIARYLEFIMRRQEDAGLLFSPRHKRSLLIRYFDFEDCYVRRLPEWEDLMKKYPIVQYHCALERGRLGKVRDGSSIMNRGFFVLEGADKKELDEYGRAVLNEFKIEGGCHE